VPAAVECAPQLGRQVVGRRAGEVVGHGTGGIVVVITRR
jgi:hypothetical protein